MTRIILVTQDDAFLDELKEALQFVDGVVSFSNKYYEAQVPVSFSLNPSDAIGCEAIVVHDSLGLDVMRYFNAAEDAAVRVLISSNTRHAEFCAENSVELFHWVEEDGVSPGKRLKAALECHPWATPEDDESSSIDFEELTSEMRQVRENAKMLSDEERREAAAKTAMKLLKFFDLSDDETPRASY